MRTRLSNNFSLKILAFLAAGLLWLIVVNIDDPIMDQNFSNIPVTVINTECYSYGKGKTFCFE